jgi:hypothetical protein
VSGPRYSRGARAALDRLPQRTGLEFVREVTEVVQSLGASGDVVERLHTWPSATRILIWGAAVRKRNCGSGAFERVEALLAGVNDPVETLKLNYSWGQLLFQIGNVKTRDSRPRPGIASRPL